MKTLTKVKIIHWHYFWNETIEIKPIVFLTGLNASGKSTLIDALQVVLLGDTAGKYFNKAASDKSNRTLRGYLKCEVGDTADGGFRYLRNGRFTSYIALEFFDDTINQNFVMGIVFDVFDDGSEAHKFFYLDDKIPENEFVLNKIPMEYKVLNKFFQETYGKSKYKFFDSNREYQSFLKKKFGGLKDKYFSLLKRATSFSPITDITNFITDYVCDPQQNINLENLQTNILEYKKLEVEAKKIEQRVERLNEISKNYNFYKESKDKFTIYQYINEKCDLETLKSKLNVFRNNLLKYTRRIQEIELEIVENNSQINEFEKRRIQLNIDKTNSDTLRITDELNKQKNEVLEKISTIKQKFEDCSKSLNKHFIDYNNSATLIINNLRSLNLNLIDEDRANEINLLSVEAKEVVKATEDFKDRFTNNCKSITKDEFIEYKTKIDSFKNNVGTLRLNFARITHDIEKRIREIETELKNMSSGNKPYNHTLVNIKNELENELMKQFGTKIEVSIFADLVDIKDLSWSNAIEGYLATNRFNLFVAPKYYYDAYRILRRLLNEYSFYHTSLIDQERIIEKRFECDDESLAEEIITEHRGARAYTNFLLGRLHKSENIKEARESGNGITKECDLYRNFSITKINPKNYQNSFIGREVNARIINEKNRELEANRQNLNNFREINRLISMASDFEPISNYELESVLKTILETSEISGLNNTLEYINEQLGGHDTTLLDAIDTRLKNIDRDLEELKLLSNDLSTEKGKLESEINIIKNEKIPQVEETIKEKDNSIKNSYDPFLVEEKAIPLFENYIASGKSYMEIYQESNSEISRLQYNVNNIFNGLVKLRREYCQDYRLSYDPQDPNNSYFDMELKDFVEVKLPQYREKITDSYNKAIHEFKDEFINKLRSAIEDAEDQIENLNQALALSEFGRDSYKFTVAPSNENKRYYDMLKDKMIYDTENDEDTFVEKYRDVMEDLFKQIVDTGNGDKNNELLSNISKFTDYRSYLDFDLIVYNKDTGEEQRLSKMIKKKSGGETQTPFYIAVLASFAQLYHVNEEGELSNTIRLIIFDEAFSKMDRGRIQEAIRLLRKFNLQVIISAPSDKVADISKLVDETLVVYHDKNSSCVRLYAKK